MSTQNVSTRSCFLYRQFNSRDELLYVGISVNPFSRLDNHKRSSWFEEIAKVTIEKFPNRILAIKAESMAIDSEKPMYNQMNGTRIKKRLAPKPPPNLPAAYKKPTPEQSKELKLKFLEFMNALRPFRDPNRVMVVRRD